MPFHYLVPYVGTGRDVDPFRPHGSDQRGWAAIDLRPDGSRLAGRALLALPVRDDHPLREYLGDDLDSPSVATRTAIGSRLGLTLAAPTLRQALPELLLQHARTDGTRWKPLRPTQRGVFEIWLGTRVWRRHPIRGGAIHTEDWSCADNAALTCDLTWNEFAGTAWAIATNRARITGNVGVSHARADVDTATDDQKVSVTVAAFTHAGGTLWVGPIARKANDTTSTFYAWIAVMNPDSGHDLHKRIAAAYTNLALPADDVVVGERMALICDGSTIQGEVDGVVLASVTDTEITGNTRAGITGASTDAGNTGEVDDWRLEDYHLVEVADTLPVLITAGIDLRASQSVADTLPVVAAEDLGSIAVTLAAAETLGLSLQETANLLVQLATVTETFGLTITETASILAAATVAVADTLAISLQEATPVAVQVLLTVADTVAVTLVEDALLVVFLAMSDTVAVDLQDAFSAFVSFGTADTVAITLDDLATLTAQFSAVDVLAVQLIEGTPTIVPTTPSAAVGLPSVIVATLVSLMPARTLTSVGLTRTLVVA